MQSNINRPHFSMSARASSRRIQEGQVRGARYTRRIFSGDVNRSEGLTRRSNPLKNASLSAAVSPTFSITSSRFGFDSLMERDEIFLDTDRLTLHEREIRKMKRRNIPEPKQTSYRAKRQKVFQQLKNLECALLEDHRNQVMSEYDELTEAQELLTKGSNTLPDESVYHKSTAEVSSLSYPKKSSLQQKRQASEWASTAISDKFSKQDSAQVRVITSAQSKFRRLKELDNLSFSQRFTPPLEKQTVDDGETSLTFALSPRVEIKDSFKIKSHGLPLADLLGGPVPPSRPGTGLESVRNQSSLEQRRWEFKERPKSTAYKFRSLQSSHLNSRATTPIGPSSQPKISQIDSHNSKLNQHFEDLFDQSVRMDVIKTRAKIIAQNKVDQVSHPRFSKKIKPQGFFQKSDKFTEGLKAMSTRFNRAISEESKLPLRAVYNETVDRMKRSEMVRFEKNMANFVVQTPIKTEVKKEINLMVLHNSKRLKIPAENKKKISLRIRKKWLKAFRKINTVMKLKRAGYIERRESNNLGGYMEAHLAQNKTVQALQTRFSSKCQSIISTHPGGEDKVIQDIPPLQFLHEPVKFRSPLDDPESALEKKREEDYENPKAPKTKMKPQIKKLIQSKQKYSRWYMKPEDLKVAKKKKDALEQYIKEVGRDTALKVLRSSTVMSDQLSPIATPPQMPHEFADPLPLRNDPFRFQIRAMQNFNKSVDQEIRESKAITMFEDSKMVKNLKKRMKERLI